jgi:hypothetical protein
MENKSYYIISYQNAFTGAALCSMLRAAASAAFKNSVDVATRGNSCVRLAFYPKATYSCYDLLSRLLSTIDFFAKKQY